MRISDWSSDVCSSDLGNAVALAEQFRPHPPPRAELRDLLEEIHVEVEEEAKPLGEFGDLAAARDQFVEIREPVGEWVPHLLDFGATGIWDMGTVVLEWVEQIGIAQGVERVRAKV